MKKNIQNSTNGLLAILMIVFGLNKFFGFIPVAPPEDLTAQQFLGSMFTSYLFVVVAIAEILGGVLIGIPKTKFLGWLVLLPVVFNIVAFHIAHDFIGNGIWILPTVLYVTSTYFQFTTIKKVLNHVYV